MKRAQLVPPKLEKGQKIAFISPSSAAAGHFSHRVDRAKRYLAQCGFPSKMYVEDTVPAAGETHSMAQRIEQIHASFRDNSVGAVICMIGGSLANELLDAIDYEIIRENPKIFCGYSDITLLHHAFATQAGLRTFYGPMVLTQLGEYPKPFSYTTKNFFSMLMHSEPAGQLSSSEVWTEEVLDWTTKEDCKRRRVLRSDWESRWLRPGAASGPLAGGCLPSLLQLLGTKYCVDLEGKILCLELPEGSDIFTGPDEVAFRAQLADLRNAGVFSLIAGLIFGRPFGLNECQRAQFEEILARACEPYSFPVLTNTSFGHTDPVLTLPFETQASLDTATGLRILEPGVSDIK